MSNLDGKEPIKPVPFDAHEQVVRLPHTHSVKEGYKPAPEKPKAKAPAATASTQTAKSDDPPKS